MTIKTKNTYQDTCGKEEEKRDTCGKKGIPIDIGKNKGKKRNTKEKITETGRSIKGRERKSRLSLA